MMLKKVSIVEAFLASQPEGEKDLLKSVSSQVFFSNVLGEDVGQSKLRALFNAFHSDCLSFIVGEDDCPDCIAQHGFK